VKFWLIIDASRESEKTELIESRSSSGGSYAVSFTVSKSKI
jgi:hypothetical protein